MNKDLHDIDDLFKNSIDGHVEEVPPDVWNTIDHSLDKKQAAFYRRKYFNIRAAAILLLLIGGATLAAILHFHDSGKTLQSNNEDHLTVPSSNKGSAQKNKIEDKISKKFDEEKNPTAQKNIPLNNDESGVSKRNESVSRSAVAEKQTLEKFGSINSSIYSGQQNGDVAVLSNRRAADKQKTPVKFRPVPKNSVDFVIAQSNKNVEEKKASQQSNGIENKLEETKSISRTIFIGTRSLKGNEIGVGTTLPRMDLGSAIKFPVFSSVAKKPRAGISFNTWSLSPMYAQNINLNTLRDDDHFPDPRNNSREAKRTEQTTTSFTAGLEIQKEVGNNIGLQSGVQYFSSQTNIQPKTIFAKPDDHGEVRYQFRCSSGDSYLSSKTGAAPSVGDSIRTNYSKSILSYLQVPLMVSYKIHFGKLSLVPSAGLQTDFLLSGKLNSSLSDPSGEEEVSSSIKGLKSMYWSGIFQPQFNYQLNNQISFDFSPNINFSLSPINKETAVKTYQNMLSLGAGVRIKL